MHSDTYKLVKILIKYNQKSKEEILEQCNVFFATNKLSEEEYEELLGYLI